MSSILNGRLHILPNFIQRHQKSIIEFQRTKCKQLHFKVIWEKTKQELNDNLRILRNTMFFLQADLVSVSYTHLDVYKRQTFIRLFRRTLPQFTFCRHGQKSENMCCAKFNAQAKKKAK